MSDLILFWHRRDLRISDNTGLCRTAEESCGSWGVLSRPNLLERDDAPVRVTYMIGCLQQLQQRYTQAGSQLLILHANPTQGYRIWQQLSMPRRFSGIGMWNLIPNSAIALLWTPQEKGIQVLPKTGINC